MSTIKLLLGSLSFAFVVTQAALAEDSGPVAYDLKMDTVYGEVHGTGLLMDVFTPKTKPNGLAIIDVVSGAWSDPQVERTKRVQTAEPVDGLRR